MTPEAVDFKDSAWEAQSMRLTVFPRDPQAAMRTDYWQEVVGESPESFQQKKIVKVAEGPYGQCQLVLQVDLQRIQWAIAPRVAAEDMLDGLVTIGSLPDALEKFAPICASWLDRCPAIERMAFGAVLLQRDADHAACYANVAKYLHNVKVDPSTRDLHYRISRRRKSQNVEGLDINRLSDWSVIQWTLALRIDQPGAVTKRFTPESEYACKLELDINTVAEYTDELPPNQYKALWSELVRFGREIAGQGDIP